MAAAGFHIIVDGYHKHAIVYTFVYLINHLLVIDRVNDKAADFVLELVDNAALFGGIKALHAAPDDLHAVGGKALGGMVHGGEHIVDEVNTLGGNQQTQLYG